MEAFEVNRSFITLKKTIQLSSLLLFTLLLVSIFSISVGTVAIPLSQILNFLVGGKIAEEYSTILFELRLPRILLAIIVGGGLSVAGVVFQAILRNPLAEPFILGVSSGGTLGAVLAISFGLGFSIISVPASAFLGSLVVIMVVYFVSEKHGRLDPTTLLLTGIMVGAFFNAMILLVMVIRHQEVRGAFLWLMGNLSSADMNSFLVVAPVVLIAIVVIYLNSRKYNLIATGDETAQSLGVEVEKFKRISYGLASLITGLVVSLSGIIGFVGLIIPHISRMIFGADHRILIPVSFLLGAILLVVVDTIARTLISPAEIPVGTVTAFIGAPIFIWLLKRSQTR